MNKLIYIFLGFFLVCVGVYGIYTGRYYGLSTGTYAAGQITLEKDFVEFLFMVGLTIYTGVMLIIKTIKEK